MQLQLFERATKSYTHGKFLFENSMKTHIMKNGVFNLVESKVLCKEKCINLSFYIAVNFSA